MTQCAERVIDKIQYILSECASSMLNGKRVAVKIKWLERMSKPIEGKADPDSSVIYINLAAIDSPRDLLRTLAHEVTHILQKIEYKSDFNNIYNRYAYSYNPFEAQADIIAENYAEDNSYEIEETIAAIYNDLHDLAYMLKRIEDGFSYASDVIEKICKRIENYISSHWDKILEACRSLPSIQKYYDDYLGPGRRRSPMASFIIDLGRRINRNKKYIDYNDKGMKTPNIDTIVNALIEKLLLALDGCHSTYCVLMKLDTLIDTIESISKDFNYEANIIIEKILSNTRVVKKIKESRFSLGEAEYLVYNTVYFPKIKYNATQILSIIEKALVKEVQIISIKAQQHEKQSDFDEETRNLLDKIARKLFLKRFKKFHS